MLLLLKKYIYLSHVKNKLISLLLLNATFKVVFLIITTVITQIGMTLKIVVYLSERRDIYIYLTNIITKPSIYLLISPNY